MIVDARTLPNDKEIKVDLCIVGAGTAGITLAREFIDRHLTVCILESGGLKPDPETQALAWGENVGHPYFSLDTAYARCLGGTTSRWMIHVGNNLFGARMRPLDAIDFEERDWVPYSGWPFDRNHLEPFYERAQRICKIDPLTYAAEDWEDKDKAPRLPLLGDRVQTVIFKFGLRDPFLYEYIPMIKGARNITVYLYANVTEIETDDSAKNVTRLHVACLNGTKFSVSARFFILAAGAIETPRLLLASNKTMKPGLGNQHDLVGRFFMEHPHYELGVFVPYKDDVFRITGLYDHINRKNGVHILGKLALSEDTLRQERLLNYVAELVPRIVRYGALGPLIHPAIKSESVGALKAIRKSLQAGALPDSLFRQVASVLRGVDDISVTAYRYVLRKIIMALGRKKVKIFRLGNMSEQEPNPMSRITLSSERDELGLCRARLDWRLSSMDLESAVRCQRILGQDLHRAGLGRLYIELDNETPPHRIGGGWHQMGTTRMHKDPTKGVVDEHCRVHGISNLYVSGPSVFPTSGYANPVLTIVALAARLADYIKGLFS